MNDLKSEKGASINEKWELESKPRGRQEKQNWLNTPANKTVSESRSH